MSRSGWKTWLLVTLILSVVIVGAISFLAWRQSVPGVRAELLPRPRFIGLKTPLTLNLTAARGGLRSLELRLVQGTQKVTVLQQAFPPPLANEHRLALTVEGRSLGPREGGATLEVYAKDGFWRPLRVDDRPILTQPVTLDLTVSGSEQVGIHASPFRQERRPRPRAPRPKMAFMFPSIRAVNHRAW